MMSVVAVPPPPKSHWALPPFPVRKITVSEYLRMIDAGIYGKYDRLELLDGYLVSKEAREGYPPVAIHRITVEKYHQMIEAGIYNENDKFELINGYLVPKMPHGTRHDSTMDQIDHTLEGKLPTPWRIRSQRAITLSDSEPEPDYAIVRMLARTFATRHPGPADIGKLIEVSDSSLLYDRNAKGALYARNNIPIYWIVNLVDNIIEVYTQPSGPTDEPAYASRQDFARRDTIPLVLDGNTVASLPVSDLLP